MQTTSIPKVTEVQGLYTLAVSWPSKVEGRKRLGIMASILVSRHLKTTEDLFDNRSSPRTESMVAAAVQWAPVTLIRDEVEGTFIKVGASNK
jgi:hypothetical protein